MNFVKKCQKCGAEFSQGLQCPQCNTFVNLLSEENTVSCPHCKERVIKGFMFCTSCGKKLTEEKEDEAVEEVAEENTEAEATEPVAEVESVVYEQPVYQEENQEEIMTEYQALSNEQAAQNQVQKFCTICGAEIQEGQLFCTTCGAKII